VIQKTPAEIDRQYIDIVCLAIKNNSRLSENQINCFRTVANYLL